LHTNDQLVSVNGVSLVGQSNAEAMESLRRALLHARPHVHGSISLTIARRSGNHCNAFYYSNGGSTLMPKVHARIHTMKSRHESCPPHSRGALNSRESFREMDVETVAAITLSAMATS
jgi:hypothetical protein